MARIRTIKPEFPQSESMGRVSREARLCFVLLWTILDDQGRARGSSRMLASLLYPYDDDAPRLIEGWLTELEHEGCLVRYKVDGDSYIASANWLKHQKIDKPSKSRLPEPTESSRIVAKPREPSAPDLVPSTLDLVPSTLDHSCGEPSQAQASPPKPVDIPIPQFLLRSKPDNPPFIALETNKDGVFYPVTEAQVAEFASLYAAVDVRQQLREMKGWLIANKAQRKTAGGMLRFVNGWLAREQNRPKPKTGSTSRPSFSDPDQFKILNPLEGMQ